MKPRDLRPLSVSDDVIDELLSDRSTERAESEWDRAARLGIRILDLMDPAYPPLLLETCDPPVLLYVRGRFWEPRKPSLAIVGTRRPTPYGVSCAEQLAADLAARGVVIVSGLARGIDAAAHRGALRRGPTVAVFGTGLDVIYPGENRELADLATAQGAVVSEFPLGVPPLPQNFPQRNRILAGMTLGTVVIEATDRSGSLITARLAADANREVFAVPGPIRSSKSLGPHRLIRQGACLVTCWQDVVDELSITVPDSLAPDDASSELKPKLTEKQRAVFESMSFSEDASIDAIIERVGLSPPEVHSAILELELLGFVRQLPGERYIRAPDGG